MRHLNFIGMTVVRTTFLFSLIVMPLIGSGPMLDNAVNNWNPWINAMGGTYDKDWHKRMKREMYGYGGDGQAGHVHTMPFCPHYSNGYSWAIIDDGSGGTSTLIGLR